MTTTIEWTWLPGKAKGRTWNPQVGCREISPACRNCYAAKLAHRGMSPQHKGLTVLRADGPHWNGEINRVPHLLAEPLSWRSPSGVFVGSMTDLFYDVETEDARRWIAAIFGIMAACPRHTFMLLTKRPENARRWYEWAGSQTIMTLHEAAREHLYQGERDRADKLSAFSNRWGGHAWPLPNVWVGVTAEDQQRFDERWPVLRQIPAALRYISHEPALSPIVLPEDSLDGSLGWVISGGESGPGARPSHPDWFRSMRDQCERTGIPWLFKQWGEWAPADTDAWTHAVFLDGKAYTMAQAAKETDESERDMLECVIHDGDGALIRRIGKKLAGRELDGRTYDGFPKVACG